MHRLLLGWVTPDFSGWALAIKLGEGRVGGRLPPARLAPQVRRQAAFGQCLKLPRSALLAVCVLPCLMTRSSCACCQPNVYAISLLLGSCRYGPSVAQCVAPPEEEDTSPAAPPAGPPGAAPHIVETTVNRV